MNPATNPPTPLPPLPRREAWALLPFFVNGSLAEPQRAQVEQALAADAALARELDWQHRIDAGLRAEAARSSEHAGRERLQALIAADLATRLPVPVAVPRGPAPRQAGWLRRGARWLAGALTPPVALAAAVMLLQGAVIVGLLERSGERDGAEMLRSGAVPATAPQAFVRLMFKPDTPEAQLRALLLQHGLRVVAGPSVLGEYWVWHDAAGGKVDAAAGGNVDAAAAQALLAQLRGSAAVVSAQRDPRLPEPGR